MINYSELKKGIKIILDNQAYEIIEFSPMFKGRGSWVARTKLKNLIYELEILVSIADKLSKSKKFTEIYDTLNDDEKRIADKYTVKAMLKIKLSDIDEIKTRLNILEKESKNVDKFILKLYENARVEVKKYLKAD